MANYCSCNIVVSGEETDIKRLFDKLNSEELKGKKNIKEIDFFKFFYFNENNMDKETKKIFIVELTKSLKLN